MWLHSFGLIYIKWFASSTYGFSRFRINEFECRISSMSVSLCPFWLKCCGTASVVLFCMALRCSPNLSRSARFVCPMYSAGAFGVFLHFRHWINIDEVFGCTSDCLLDMMYLACVLGLLPKKDGLTVRNIGKTNSLLVFFCAVFSLYFMVISCSV